MLHENNVKSQIVLETNYGSSLLFFIFLSLMHPRSVLVKGTTSNSSSCFFRHLSLFSNFLESEPQDKDFKNLHICICLYFALLKEMGRNVCPPVIKDCEIFLLLKDVFIRGI